MPASWMIQTSQVYWLLHYLGYCDVDDEVYQATRRTILSPENPYFTKENTLEGLGSSYLHRYIWPIAFHPRLDNKIRRRRNLLDQLVACDGDRCHARKLPRRWSNALLANGSHGPTWCSVSWSWITWVSVKEQAFAQLILGKNHNFTFKMLKIKINLEWGFTSWKCCCTYYLT